MSNCGASTVNAANPCMTLSMRVNSIRVATSAETPESCIAPSCFATWSTHANKPSSPERSMSLTREKSMTTHRHSALILLFNSRPSLRACFASKASGNLTVTAADIFSGPFLLPLIQRSGNAYLLYRCRMLTAGLHFVNSSVSRWCFAPEKRRQPSEQPNGLSAATYQSCVGNAYFDVTLQIKELFVADNGPPYVERNADIRALQNQRPIDQGCTIDMAVAFNGTRPGNRAPFCNP